jgi:hypothetical protein
VLAPGTRIEEGLVAICRIYEARGATLDQYNEVDEQFPDMPPEARYHVAGSTGDAIYVIEVWESREAVENYMQQIGPALEQAGIPEPKVTEFEVHNEQRGG